MKTAFVLAGGGSLGAVQVGMLRELLVQGVTPDLIVGSSAGAINGAYIASSPTLDRIERLGQIWRDLRRQDIFPITLRSLAAFLGRQSYVVDSHGIRSLLMAHLGYKTHDQATVPLHLVATDVHGGTTVRLSQGSVIDAVLASCAIPGAFPHVRIGEHDLIDGAVASNTPIRTAIELGADRLLVLPTGFACALDHPPASVIGATLHAINLLTAHQVVADLERYGGQVEIITVPPLCPLAVSPYDFSKAADLIERASTQTRRWLEHGGLHEQRIPGALRPHQH